MALSQAQQALFTCQAAYLLATVTHEPISPLSRSNSPRSSGPNCYPGGTERQYEPTCAWLTYSSCRQAASMWYSTTP